MVFGKVFCFGLIFCVEKFKMCWYLMEFWMVEFEVVFFEFEGFCGLVEDFFVEVVGCVVECCVEFFCIFEWDVEKFENVVKLLLCICYVEVIEIFVKVG